jgi:hypothetical protein
MTEQELLKICFQKRKNHNKIPLNLETKQAIEKDIQYFIILSESEYDLEKAYNTWSSNPFKEHHTHSFHFLCKMFADKDCNNCPVNISNRSSCWNCLPLDNLNNLFSNNEDYYYRWDARQPSIRSRYGGNFEYNEHRYRNLDFWKPRWRSACYDIVKYLKSFLENDHT